MGKREWRQLDNLRRITIFARENQTNYIMTTVVYKVKGMMCSHCVMHVQKALDSIPGVKADVTLDPPQARIEFSDKVYGMDELQAVISEKAGEYVLEN